jgi:hypothetical protein
MFTLAVVSIEKKGDELGRWLGPIKVEFGGC